MNKNIVVLGGAGFIGSHLTDSLVAAGAKVQVIDLLSSNTENLLGVVDRVRFLKADIQHLEWDRILIDDNVEYIFFLAGHGHVPLSVDKPDFDFHTNLLTSFTLLEAIRKTGWNGVLIFPSSAAVYGNPLRIPIREDDPTIPISPYGVSKLCIERYISVYCNLYSLRAASVRPFSIYGPRQKKLVVYDLIMKLLGNPDEIHLFGDGTQVRDFLFIQDTVNGFLNVAQNGALKGEVYNLASGREHSILELTEVICSIMNVRPRLIFSGKARPGDPEKWKVDISKISDIGFFPTTSIEQGLRQTYDWVKLISRETTREIPSIETSSG